MRQTSKKNGLKPWLKTCWRIPPKANEAFVCAMEDVPGVYSGDYDDGTVLVCVDETSKQQTKETRKQLPVRPGRPDTTSSTGATAPPTCS